MLPDFFFCSLFPVQQTTSGIGHRVKYGSFFRVGDQYAECEKQQQQQQQQATAYRWRLPPRVHRHVLKVARITGGRCLFG